MREGSEPTLTLSLTLDRTIRSDLGLHVTGWVDLYDP